ncbi:hypothetical protein C8Q76DRAFT_693976 [Earliella scabrosa]|nr:hypothetical protein C8Q76DRAFT_693976 [Earliella scabrosa]
MPDSGPGIELSTPHAHYIGELRSCFDREESWTHATVVLAELTSKTYALVVCPTLSCNLVPYPPSAIVQMLIPEDGLLLKTCSSESRVIGLRRWTAGVCTDFTLHFAMPLEFWDCLRIISRVMTEGEAQRFDAMDAVKGVLNTIPTHTPKESGARKLCTNDAHYQNAPNVQEGPSL